MAKVKDYDKKIILKCVGGVWTVKYLEGKSDSFISRKDLNDARRLMYSRHRLYHRNKLMEKRMTKTSVDEKPKAESEVVSND